MDRRFYVSVVITLFFIVTAVLLTYSEEKIDPLLSFFLYSIPSNAAISFLPHEPVLIFLGSSYDPFILAIIATVSTLLAGILDYSIYVPLLSHNSIRNITTSISYQKTIQMFKYRPFLTLIVAGMTPIPFFIFKIISFSAHYPLPKYLGAVAIGRFPRYFFLAFLGEVLQIPDWMTISAFIVMVLLFLFKGLPYIKELLFTESGDGVNESNIYNLTKEGVNSKCNLDM